MIIIEILAARERFAKAQMPYLIIMNRHCIAAHAKKCSRNSELFQIKPKDRYPAGQFRVVLIIH